MTDEKNPDQPSQPNSPSPSGENAPPKKHRFGLFYILLLILAVISLQAFLSSRYNQATFDEFEKLAREGFVKSVRIEREQITGEIEIPEERRTELYKAKKDEPQNSPKRRGLTYEKAKFRFRVNTPVNELRQQEILAALKETDATIEFKPESSFWTTFFIWMLPLFLIIFLWFMLMRQSGQLGRTAMSFGKARAKLAQDGKENVDFGDVAGCDEAKEELQEVVDFLKNPRKYQTLGGRMPKGILLVGPPGTGKTLLAKAVAGEAGKPFFQLSGSDFVEMFVGVGASRVRDLFQQAKVKAPCIVFVDELDAVGRHRGAGLGGGHDEREQTLNQLLVEMDGFDTTSGVIFLAATNRPDVLDPALLRPGRFDRQVIIDAPDLKGREEILAVHARGKPIDENLDLHAIAASTVGMTGADLANVLNEAALLAARRKKDNIGQAEVDEAVERVMSGPQRKSMRITDDQKERTAVHEAGHALVAEMSEFADPVRKITIVPRGRALGLTMMTPEEDQYAQRKEQLLDLLKVLMGGRAADLLVFGEQWTGASNDLERASQVARAMVCRLGMSESLGPVVYGRDHQQVFLGRDMTQEERNYSEQTAQQIDTEVRRLLDQAHEDATKILAKNRECLKRLAELLLEQETVSGKELDELLEREPCAGEGSGDDPESGESVESAGVGSAD